MSGPPKLNLPPRNCALDTCQTLLIRRPGEDASDWRRRRYCNPGCSSRALKGRSQAIPVSTPTPGWQERAWQERAACRGTEEEWWTDSTSAEEENRLRQLAREFCAGCVVRGSCRMQGRREKFGLFGGVLWRTELGRPAQIDLLDALEEVAS